MDHSGPHSSLVPGSVSTYSEGQSVQCLGRPVISHRLYLDCLHVVIRNYTEPGTPLVMIQISPY